MSPSFITAPNRAIQITEECWISAKHPSGALFSALLGKGSIIFGAIDTTPDGGFNVVTKYGHQFVLRKGCARNFSVSASNPVLTKVLRGILSALSVVRLSGGFLSGGRVCDHLKAALSEFCVALVDLGFTDATLDGFSSVFQATGFKGYSFSYSLNEPAGSPTISVIDADGAVVLHS